MFPTWLIAGFLLGAVSSFHCVGMCGPIAVSLPVYYLPPGRKLAGILLYHSGRILIYSLLGLFFGYLGRQIFLGGLQQGFSIFLGSVLLLFFLASILHTPKRRIRQIDRLTVPLQQFIGKHLQKKTLSSMLLLGAANGLLPCGMVYFAITGALAAGSISEGVLFMAAFGLGTFPAMFALSYFGSKIGQSARNTMKKAVPYVVLLMGVLLILRGLNLNIPYVSPYLSSQSRDILPCH
ncbi:MAG: sulfite exporter TauE/SafE family protein [Bacteroidota bacterium]|nr:sulfite exporter TauE/SafE family protein [Bacteroidota bacterium]